MKFFYLTILKILVKESIDEEFIKEGNLSGIYQCEKKATIKFFEI